MSLEPALPLKCARKKAIGEFSTFTVCTLSCYTVISPPTAPTTPTLKELSNALDSVVNWFSLGVKLGVEDHELRTIEQNYRGDNERSKLEMLSRWLRSGKLPTWKAVVDALHLMGEQAVASKLQARYCSSSSATTDTPGTHVFVYTMWVLSMQREMYRVSAEKMLLFWWYCRP